MKWRGALGVLCDHRILIGLNGKLYKTSYALVHSIGLLRSNIFIKLLQLKRKSQDGYVEIHENT